jgi:hypothetical protein
VILDLQECLHIEYKTNRSAFSITVVFIIFTIVPIILGCLSRFQLTNARSIDFNQQNKASKSNAEQSGQGTQGERASLGEKVIICVDLTLLFLLFDYYIHYCRDYMHYFKT